MKAANQTRIKRNRENKYGRKRGRNPKPETTGRRAEKYVIGRTFFRIPLACWVLQRSSEKNVPTQLVSRPDWAALCKRHGGSGPWRTLPLRRCSKEEAMQRVQNSDSEKQAASVNLGSGTAAKCFVEKRSGLGIRRARCGLLCGTSSRVHRSTFGGHIHHALSLLASHSRKARWRAAVQRVGG